MRSGKLEELLSRPGFTLMDGGMGTTIEDRGISVKNDLWGSSALLDARGIEENDRIHRDFEAAGAEILIANTHNASLASCGDRALFERINREAVASARRAGDAAVAGCIGSAEPAYSIESRMTKAEVIARLSPQAELLASLPIDLLLFETISTRSEVEGIAEIVERIGVPVGVGFTCSERGTTHGGVGMKEIAGLFPSARLLFVQCTRYDLVERPLDALLDAIGDPRRLGVYANDGRKWIARSWHGERISAETYRAHAERWAARSVAVIGGCCGTGPEHIAELAALARRLKSSRSP